MFNRPAIKQFPVISTRGPLSWAIFVGVALDHSNAPGCVPDFHRMTIHEPHGSCDGIDIGLRLELARGSKNMARPINWKCSIDRHERALTSAIAIRANWPIRQYAPQFRPGAPFLSVRPALNLTISSLSRELPSRTLRDDLLRTRLVSGALAYPKLWLPAFTGASPFFRSCTGTIFEHSKLLKRSN